jgi:hypothetical protein
MSYELFWTTRLVQSKFLAFMPKVKLNAENLITIDPKYKSADMNLFRKYLRRFVAVNNASETNIYGINTTFPNLEDLKFNRGLIQILISYDVYKLKCLTALSTNYEVETLGLCALPNLTKLTTSRIWYDSDAIVKLPIRHLVLNTKNNKKAFDASLSLPYGQIFPDLEHLELDFRFNANCNAESRIADLPFLSTITISSYSKFIIKIKLSHLDALRKVDVYGGCEVNFCPESQFGNLRKISFCNPLKVQFENLNANPDIICEFRYSACAEPTKSIIDAVRDLNQQYKLRVIMTLRAPLYDWNVKSISGDPIRTKHVHALYQENPSIITNLTSIGIIRVNTHLHKYGLENAMLLQKITVDCDFYLSKEDIRFLVKIQIVHMKYDNQSIIDIFRTEHEKLLTQNTTRICKEIICNTACSKLTAYARRTGLVYRRNISN